MNVYKYSKKNDLKVIKDGFIVMMQSVEMNGVRGIP